jgi:hypothetical protein
MCVRYFLIGPSLDFPASKEVLVLMPLKVARQLLAVVRSPQKISVCAMAGKIPIRYDGTLLVKHLPSLPVRMRAGGPGARRGFFCTAATHITPEETAVLSIIPPSSVLSACASFSSSA